MGCVLQNEQWRVQQPTLPPPKKCLLMRRALMARRISCLILTDSLNVELKAWPYNNAFILFCQRKKSASHWRRFHCSSLQTSKYILWRIHNLRGLLIDVVWFLDTEVQPVEPNNAMVNKTMLKNSILKIWNFSLFLPTFDRLWRRTSWVPQLKFFLVNVHISHYVSTKFHQKIWSSTGAAIC